ncbi:MAG: rod shape-determining protein RodA [Planctomycetia bacterium]|nr:rod shape-determining protein RodA [Planctomycetia bacterium]
MMLSMRNNSIKVYIIIIPIIFLIIISLMALYSISLHQNVQFYSSSFFKQFIFLIFGIIAMIVMLNIPVKLYHKYSIIMYIIAIIAIIVPSFIDSSISANRWIHVGSIGIQPSEYAKWISIIFLARYLSDRNVKMDNMLSFAIPIFIVFLPAFIVFSQPDLGTAIIMIAPILPVLFWVQARPYHLFILIAPILSVLTAFHNISFTLWGIVLLAIILLSKPKIWEGVTVFFGNIFLGLLAPVFWNILHPYQQKRILTLFNPELDPLGAAYQIIQSQTAIGSGGFFGRGWMQGTQTQLKFLPVQETDFILSVIGEEFGFVAILAIFLLYAFIIYKIIQFAYIVKDRFTSIILIGIASILIAQVFVNSAMTVGLIPVKGLPLPFISYGGSFLVSSFMMMGIVLNFAAHWSD